MVDSVTTFIRTSTIGMMPRKDVNEKAVTWLRYMMQQKTNLLKIWLFRREKQVHQAESEHGSVYIYKEVYNFCSYFMYLFCFFSDYLDRPAFKWQDTTQLEFTNWANGEPNNANDNEACGQIYANGYWNDAPCTQTNVMAYVCKRERPTEVN